VPAQHASGIHFHGLNGSLAEHVVGQGQSPACVGPRAGSGAGQPQPQALQQQAGATMPAAGPEWECVVVLTSGLVDLLDPGELHAVMAGCLGLHAALTSKAVDATAAAPGGQPQHPTNSGASNSGSSSDAERQRARCRSLGAMHTLGALCVLCPEVLSQRLPPQLAPLFVPRIQPVLLRGLKYLAFYCDR
jgi:hypothetical protein